MIEMYANQSLTLKVPGTPNEYNEPTYTSSTIKGRKESNFKLVRDVHGDEVVSSSFVVTESAVEVGNLIDDKVVIASNPMPDLDGNIQFYEVYLA